MAKRTTIKDVAALAGVSFATVSRALDDHPDISRETKEKVRAACAQLGYVPNSAARGLVGQATHTIGVIVPDISNPYFSDMATAIEQAAAEHGYRMLLSNSMRDPNQELHAIDGFLSRQIDGILISPLSPDTQRAHQAILGDLPCVYIGVNHDGQCSYVASDNQAGAYRATRYLLELGHRDLVYLGGRERSLTREQRAAGFRQALREAGLTGRACFMTHDPADSGRKWSYDIALQLFRQERLPDAVVAFSDIMALRVMEAAEVCGVRIPEDVSLVGYDNISFSALPRIRLTTVSQKKRRQGRLAVAQLLSQIQGDRHHVARLIQPELIVRSTCAEKQGR